MKHFSNTTKLGILIAVIAVPVFGYFIFSAFGGTFINKTLQRDSLDQGLVAHYTFDGDTISGTTVNDVSGNGNNGTVKVLDTGDGADGAVSITTAKNINTDTIAGGRSYADGIAYRVVAPADGASSVARHSGSVTLSNGIAAGDEVLLINLNASSGDTADVGSYEVIGVSSITASTVTFTQAITKSYDGTTALT